MNLYLSSYRIPTRETLYQMLPKPADKCVVGIIVNAKDFRPYPELERSKLEALVKDLQGLGFEEHYFIDLLHVDEDFSFAVFDVVYGAGGNTFALSYALHQSGHVETLREYIENGGLYIGESAGALIVGKNIDQFDTIDDKEAVPKIYGSGIGILNEIICPHADSPDYKEQVANAAAYYQRLGEKTILLNDNQAYVVIDDEAKVETGEYFGNPNRSRT